jgi:uncharacterized protein involved in exopolysaccharide biosynthesis
MTHDVSKPPRGRARTGVQEAAMRQALAGDLRRSLLWMAVARHWPYIAVALVVAPIAAMVTAHLEPPRYTAEAIIGWDNTAAPQPLVAALGAQFDVYGRLLVIDDLFASTPVAERVLRRVGALNDMTSDIEASVMIEFFTDSLQVHGLPEFEPGPTDERVPGGVVSLAFSSPDAQDAVDGLDELLQVFLEATLVPQRLAFESSARFLATELERVDNELEVVETAIAAFQRNNPDSLPAVFQANLTLLTQRQALLLEEEAFREGYQRQVDDLIVQLRRFDPRLSEIDARVQLATAEVVRLRQTYADEHPRLRAALQELGRLQFARGELAARGNEIELNELLQAIRASATTPQLRDVLASYEAALRSLEGSTPRVERLQRQIEELSEDLLAHSADQQVMFQLLRDAEGLRSEHRDFSRRLRETQLSVGLIHEDIVRPVWIAAPPTLRDHEGRIGLATAAAGGLSGALLLALFIVLIAELFDPTVRVPEEAVRESGVPILAVIPELGRSGRRG